MDLVVTSLEAWDSVWRRNQHLVAGLLRDDPGLQVLFVEPSTDPLHAALGRARPHRGRGLRPAAAVDGIADGALWLLEPTKWLPRRVDHGVDERWARQVLRAARTLGMTRPVLWVNDPTGALVVAATGWPSLYDVTDDWTLAERTAAELERMRRQEELLLARCDEVVVCSPGLERSKGAERSVTLVPNGVDTAAYRRPHVRPGDLPPGRVVLYAGTLHADRFDVDLGVRLATGLAEGSDAAHLVLVGPDALGREDSERLAAAGALVLGARPYPTIPAYLQHADVLVVPHVVTPFTDSLDPIKLYEYAAASRPVVTTPVAGFRDTQDPLVRVAPREELVAAVRHVLVDPPGDVRDRGARLDGLDWSERVARMRTVLDRVGDGARP